MCVLVCPRQYIETTEESSGPVTVTDFRVQLSSLLGVISARKGLPHCTYYRGLE